MSYMPVGIVFIVIAIVLLVWVFLIREPKEKKKEKIVKNDNLIIAATNDLGLPEEFFHDLKSILGPDFEHPQIKLVWDDFCEKPSDFAYYDLITSPLLAMELFAKAEEFISFSTKYVTDNYELYLHLGDIRAQMADLAGAEAAYSKSIEIDSSQVKPLMNLGYTLIGLEQFDKAHDILAKLLVAHPDNLKARLYLGTCLYHIGQYEDAYRELNAVYKIDQRIPQVHYFIGMTFVQMDNKKSAHMALSRYLSMHPDGMYAMDASKAIDEIEVEIPELALSNNPSKKTENSSDKNDTQNDS